jgi:cytochrome P450
MWPTMFDWTNRIIGSTDPEYQVEGQTTTETFQAARLQLFAYFAEMARERKAGAARGIASEDIVSVIANSEIDGAGLPDRELLSYFFLLVVAGNETTRNAMTGGLLALLDHRDQWERLRRDPSLVDSAVEEIVRWTTPVIQFCRTPVEDVEIRGKKIRAGENLCLFYPSANRDEEIFKDPFAFRIDRKPNRHIAFGIGEHFCLGANLARLELRVMFRHLVARLAECEPTGPPERLRSSFVGGIKRMPIRYRLEPAKS